MRRRRVYICHPDVRMNQYRTTHLSRLKDTLSSTYGYTCVGPFETIRKFCMESGVKKDDIDMYCKMKYVDELIALVESCKAIYFVEGWEEDEFCRIVYNYTAKRKYEVIYDVYRDKDEQLLKMEQHFGIDFIREDGRCMGKSYRIRMCYAEMKRNAGWTDWAIADELHTDKRNIERLHYIFKKRLLNDLKLRQIIYETDRLFGYRNLVNNKAKKKKDGI